jgi:NAD(P)-dependent dehydrogenase (short-subunit alcohol dehydrogenase family)
VSDTGGRPGGLSVDLRDTVSVVVGGSVGIGQAIALALAASGSTVVVAARDEGRLTETCERAVRQGGTAYAAQVDVTSVTSIAGLAETVVARHGVPRVLVNSAGVMVTKPAFQLTPDDWDTVHATQLRGPFLTCQAFGRQMATAGYGKIVNLSSVWAYTVGRGRSAYSAAKAGLSHLTAALAAEWAADGIRVNAIAPSATRTPGAERRMRDEPGREEYLLERTPLRRIATPDDVVGAALFLASAASDFVTGETILVDGGWRAAK